MKNIYFTHTPDESFRRIYEGTVARDNLFRCYSISRFRFLCCFKKMENVINFFGLAARATFSEKPRSCYRSVLHARTIAAAPAAIDIFFPRYVENASKGERQKERERGGKRKGRRERTVFLT